MWQTNTPAVIQLKRGNGYFAGNDYKVRLEADGYESSATNIHSHLNGWYVGNILFGGIIGLVILDPATGGMWALSPKTMNVTLDASPSKAAVLETNVQP